MAQRTCSVEDCDRPQLARGWCGTHYRRWWTTAPASAKRLQRPRPRREPWDRFREKFQVVEHGCWEWTAAKVPAGYGTFWVAGKFWIASRWSWTHTYGPIPDGLYVDHFLFPGRCIGPSCVNPEHLRPVAPWESVLRSESAAALGKAKSHCSRGHLFDEANTRHNTDGRQCRACDRDLATRSRRKLNPEPKVPERDRTHCPRGHAYDEANTTVFRGKRKCRTCDREKKRERYHLRKHAE